MLSVQPYLSISAHLLHQVHRANAIQTSDRFVDHLVKSCCRCVAKMTLFVFAIFETIAHIALFFPKMCLRRETPTKMLQRIKSSATTALVVLFHVRAQTPLARTPLAGDRCSALLGKIRQLSCKGWACVQQHPFVLKALGFAGLSALTFAGYRYRGAIDSHFFGSGVVAPTPPFKRCVYDVVIGMLEGDMTRLFEASCHMVIAYPLATVASAVAAVAGTGCCIAGLTIFGLRCMI